MAEVFNIKILPLITSLFSNNFFSLLLVFLFSSLIAWCLIKIIIRILHAVFRVPLAFDKVVMQVTVPKETVGSDKQKNSATPQPKTIKEVIAVMENFYSNLGGIKPRNKWKAFLFGREDEFSLEIVADGGLVKFFLVVPDHLEMFVGQQLHAQIPFALIEVVKDYNIFQPHGEIFIALLRLNRHWIFPLKTYKKMDSDPLDALTNALSKVENGQGAAIQYVIRSAKKGWRSRGQKVAKAMKQGKKLDEALRSAGVSKTSEHFFTFIFSVLNNLFSIFSGAKDNKKDPAKDYRLSPMEEELVKSLEEKASKAGFEVNIRVVASAVKPEMAKMQLYNIINAFAQYLGVESGVGFKKVKYFRKNKNIKDFIYRHFNTHHKFILNSEELTSLFHLPINQTETPNIAWLKAKSAPAPVNMPQEGVLLGENVYRGKKTPVHMLADDRRRHMYIVGTTGSGKTTLMLNMIKQDIKDGHGCCYIDPHGEAIDDILQCIPKERMDDVVVFDPGDFQRPLGLNLLEFDPDFPEQKTFVVNEMILIMDKLYDLKNTGGPMFEQYMRNAMLLIMEDPASGSTLMEIPKVLADEEYRRYKLTKAFNPVVRDFWTKEAQKAGGDAALANMVPYITSKLNQFVSNDIMRPIIGQQQSAFNIRSVMDKKQILLVKLSKGRLGDMNSHLLGMIIVGKITMAALSRTGLSEEQKKDFYLYIDEFQNFITDSIATILSEARKYNLNLTLGHQYISQLVPKQGDTKVKDAIFGNVGSICCFRVGVDDAEVMAKQMAPVFSEFDVMNIEARNAYVRLLIKGTAARPFNMRTFAPPKGDLKIADKIREISRLRHGRDRLIVESEILQRAGKKF